MQSIIQRINNISITDINKPTASKRNKIVTKKVSRMSFHFITCAKIFAQLSTKLFSEEIMSACCFSKNFYYM